MIAYRAHPKPHASPAPPRPDEVPPGRWRAIYALCRPEELRAEEIRLARLAAENAALAPQARMRRALVLARLRALGAS